MRWFTALAAVFKGGSLAKPVEISHWLTVGGQPTADDLKALKKQGFRSVVNLRRAGENNQPLTPEKERAEAEAAGLAYYHLPALRRAAIWLRLFPTRPRSPSNCRRIAALATARRT